MKKSFPQEAIEISCIFPDSAPSPLPIGCAWAENRLDLTTLRVFPPPHRTPITTIFLPCGRDRRHPHRGWKHFGETAEQLLKTKVYP
jgi:hypothetical protein